MNEKLKPHEVSLFRRVFLARINEGATVESAEKQALHACKIWERLGAYSDGPSEEKAKPAGTNWEALWNVLASAMGKNEDDAPSPKVLSERMVDLWLGDMSEDEFREWVDGWGDD